MKEPLLQEGEFIGIMEPSGSGKTTLLNVISTMEKLNELQVAKYKNVKAEELGITYQMYNQSHGMASDSCLWASSLELRS
ncbi:hypothetical protein AXF43_31135 [Bacillus paranthracis]|nr:hypothetical protein [Bacillus paranthracis]